MPGTEKATKAAGRCESHPRRQAEYVCDSCGKPLCLTCAIPVRGRVLGPECVGVATGEESRGAAPKERLDRNPALVGAGAAFLAALVGTILPWSAPNYSHYTGLFGGWGTSPLAWSLVAAVGAVGGFALSVVIMVSRSSPASRRWLLVAAASVCFAGSVLYLLWPPFATHPWLGPWVTLFAAAAALAGSLWAARETAPDRPDDS